MQLDWSQIAQTLTPTGGVLVSILSGAGGAALLELWWKPRRARRQVATILLGEILNNTQLMVLQANARWSNPRGMPADFRLELQGWDAAQTNVAELPHDLLKGVMLLYSRFRSLNNAIELHGNVLDEFNSIPAADTAARQRTERLLVSSLDVFNTGLDHAIDHAKELMPRLLKLSRIRERKPRPNELRDYAKDVDEFLKARNERIEALLRSSPHRKTPGS